MASWFAVFKPLRSLRVWRLNSVPENTRMEPARH